MIISNTAPLGSQFARSQASLLAFGFKDAASAGRDVMNTFEFGKAPIPQRQFSKLGFPFGVLFIRVPYYFGDLERDPNLESYPERGSYSGSS